MNINKQSGAVYKSRSLGSVVGPLAILAGVVAGQQVTAQSPVEMHFKQTNQDIHNKDLTTMNVSGAEMYDPVSEGLPTSTLTSTFIRGIRALAGGYEGGMAKDVGNSQITTYNFPSGRTAHSCAMNRDTVIFGLDNGTAMVYIGQDSSQITIDANGHPIDDIYIADNGKTYFCTGGGSVYVVSKLHPLVIESHISVGGTGIARRMIGNDTNSQLTLVSGVGIETITNNTVSATDNLSGLPNAWKYSSKSIAKGLDSTLRVAGKGLAKKEVGSSTRGTITMPERLSLESIQDIKVDSHGYVYVASTNLSVDGYPLSVYDPTTDTRRKIDGFGPNGEGVDGVASELGLKEDTDGSIVLSVSTSIQGNTGNAWYILNISYGPNGIATMNVQEKPSIISYPNPTTEMISVLNMEQKNITRAQVIDQTGKVVAEQNFTGGEKISLDVRDLVPGTYMMICEGKNGSVYSAKFIKQ